MPRKLQPAGAKFIMILLGQHHNLKVGHRQCGLSECPLAEAVAGAFRASTSPSDRLTAFSTVSQWTAFLNKYVKKAGFDYRWTAHSPRAGWAVEIRLKGLAFTEIRERGRWRSDASLRTYLDMSNSLYMDIDMGPEEARRVD